ncbi:monofunctional biosynthetic peptidoglycan transglycosylase [Lichenibacterium ramalinae]|uniref:Biosynthetic peptidoglycan transglycosylase n=1 Tax=Lichenibacterium ramalinae TaxID=2316527 RepID=A0A4Q2RCD8_9HYPH|nr:monofunctional biosynthetic peptidoglycan transglycosylase [Lichenibacterium ramalinae]RYB03437.1 monofunctional biosynthetic peptidoglycan transglycosylase [Lichenibacterium ramalinae]
MVRWALRLAFLLGAVAAGALALQTVIHPVSTLMAGRWLTGQPVDRRWVPLAAVSPKLVASVILSEDGQFCHEHGIDVSALREVIADGDGAPARGASTITMQVAKNLFLWPGRSYLRKALEIPLAVLLDALWGKRRVLEAYLNVAEWGEGIYGIEAAAQDHFHVGASALTGRQAALLATALPNPILRSVTQPSRHHRQLARRILDMQGIAGPHVACVE